MGQSGLPKAILETARPYVERLEECRVLGELLIAECNKGVYEDATAALEMCLGVRIPPVFTKEHYSCIYVEISSQLF